MSKGRINKEEDGLITKAAAGITHMFGSKTKTDTVVKEAKEREERRQNAKQKALEQQKLTKEEDSLLLAGSDDCSHSTVSDAPPSEGLCWEDETWQDERLRHRNQVQFFYQVVTYDSILKHFFLSWGSALGLSLISSYFVTCAGAPAWIYFGVLLTGVAIGVNEKRILMSLEAFSSRTHTVGFFHRRPIPEKDARGTIPETILNILRTHRAGIWIDMAMSVADYYDLLGDLLFPAIARYCDESADGHLTRIFAESFRNVPFVGPGLTNGIAHLKFFGISIILLLINVILGQGIRGFIRLGTLKDRDKPSLPKLREACDVAGVMALGQMLDRLLKSEAFVNTMAAGIQEQHDGAADTTKTKRETKDERRTHTDSAHREDELAQVVYNKVFYKVLLENLPQMELQTSLLAATASYHDDNPNPIVCGSIALGALTVMKEITRLKVATQKSQSLSFKVKALLMSTLMIALTCHVAMKVFAIYVCKETHVLSILEGGCMHKHH